ncbi:MAG: helix-turn-helix transcriptional regulator [Chloroflexi bacterium]|nr:helix-turn-helix transcriptional regulator [Chloroflexota bacterium]
MAKLTADDQAAMRVYKALGHPQRFRIIRMLSEREELGCGDLMAACGLSAPALSHHTRILQECGLLLVRREGAYHYFSLDTEQLARYAPGLVISRAGAQR